MNNILKNTFGFISQLNDAFTQLPPSFYEGLPAQNEADYVQRFEEKLLFTPSPIIPVGGQLPSGDPINGLFSLVTLTSAQMLRMCEGGQRAQVLEKILATVNALSDCNIVGLGSLTGSSVTGSGLIIQGRANTWLTSGNSFAALATVMSVEKIAQRLGLKLDQLTVGVLGATGSIGQGVSMELSKSVGKVVLAARQINLLERLKKIMPGQTVITTEIDDLKEVDILVVTTASSETLISVDWPKKGMIIVDETKPRNTPSGLKNREDVIVLDGALISVPDIDFNGMNMECPSGTIYACFAETMMLSLQGVNEHFNLGRVNPEVFPDMRILSQRYGLDIAPFYSFGNLISEDRYDDFAKLLK